MAFDGRPWMEIKGVIFDVDGTLVDSNEQHVTAWQRALKHLGHDVSRERIAVEVGKGGDKLVPAILGEAAEQRIGKEARQGHTEEFHRLIEQRPARLLPGAIELLRELRQRGVRTVLATSSKREELEAVERSCGTELHREVDALVTADDADASKPEPDLVEAACVKLGLRPGTCIMVGDTPYDVEASARAGVSCVGLLSGRQHSEQSLIDAGVRGIFRDPADLLDHLNQILEAQPA